MEKYKKYPNLKNLRLWALVLLAWSYACQKPPPPDPLPPVETDYSACAPAVSDTTFELATWNLENFPQSGRATTEVARIITTFNLDLVGFQEVSSSAAMNKLLELLPGWQGVIFSSGNINTGYLFKESEITLSGFTAIYQDMWEPFPRPPVVARVNHVSGLQATLINIHLKCCGGSDNIARRTEASRLLKEYIDTNMPDEPVILLGDYNDEITSDTDPTPFRNFIDDTVNYRFADWDIATGSASNWSYPSWPSHIDHILITNELFDKVVVTTTLKPEQCYSGYPSLVSDHRPVMLQLVR